MENKLNIEPFNEFWINCIFNCFMSIKISQDSRYKLLAYNNDYKYIVAKEMSEGNKEFQYLMLLAKSVDYYNKYNNIVEINYDDTSISQVLKEHVDCNKIVLLGVDLFYWIPDSICWNKYHWYHYSLIKGYDAVRKVFYVLDENVHGYNEFEIPEERMTISANNCKMKEKAFIVEPIYNPEFQCNSFRDIKENANKIVQNINEILDNFENFWVMTEWDYDSCQYEDLNAMYLFQIRNRQKANRMLINSYIDSITSKKHNKLFEYCDKLEDGWTVIQHKLVKAYHSKDKVLSIIKTNELCQSLLKTEREMWQLFVQ